MSVVTAVVPEEIIENSPSKLFLIVLVTKSQYMAWYSNGFHGAQKDGFKNMGLFRKDNVVDEYYTALRMAREELTDLYSGNLEIIALPTFSGDKI